MKVITYEHCSINRIKDYISRFIDTSKNSLNIDRYTCICATTENRIVGIIVSEKILETSVIIKLIFVIPAYRKTGVGSTLWQKLLSFHKKYTRKYLIFLVDYDNDDCKLSKFFSRLGFVHEISQSIGLAITVKEYLNKISEKIARMGHGVQATYISFDELEITDQEVIMNLPEYSVLPPSFSFNLNRNHNEIQLVFYSDMKDLLGWCICTIVDMYVVNFRCSYVRVAYRNYRNIFFFWNVMTEVILKKVPSVEKLIFYYDREDYKVKHLYEKLFSKSNYKPIYRKTLVYELPFC